MKLMPLVIAGSVLFFAQAQAQPTNCVCREQVAAFRAILDGYAGDFAYHPRMREHYEKQKVFFLEKTPAHFCRRRYDEETFAAIRKLISTSEEGRDEARNELGRSWGQMNVELGKAWQRHGDCVNRVLR